MSSAHVLLSSLQDHSNLSVESCRAMLAELLSLCRYDELKSEIVNHGVDALLALAQDETLRGADVVVEALLELLTALMLDTLATRERLVQKGVLHVGLDAFDGFLDKKPTKRRNKIIKLALKMTDQWSCVGESQRPEHQDLAIARVLRTLENTADDGNILLHAAEVLGCVLERNVGNIQTVAKRDGIPILLRLLEMVRATICACLTITCSCTDVSLILLFFVSQKRTWTSSGQSARHC